MSPKLPVPVLLCTYAQANDIALYTGCSKHGPRVCELLVSCIVVSLFAVSLLSALHSPRLFPSAGMSGRCLALSSLQTTWEAPRCMS